MHRIMRELNKVWGLCLALCCLQSVYAQKEVQVSTQDTLISRGESALLKVDTLQYIANPTQNYFFQLQVGMSHSMSESVRYQNFFEAERPAYQFSFGKFFYPQFGMRASLAWVNQRGYVDQWVDDYIPHGWKKYYDFSVGQLFADGMVNLTNVVCGVKPERRFHLIGFIGLGYLRTFGFDQNAKNWKKRFDETTDADGNWLKVQETVTEPDGTTHTVNKMGYNVDYHGHNYFGGRFGLMASYRISDAWDLTFEATFTGTDDAYNGYRYQRVYDSYVTGLLGITYNIKDQKGRHRYRYAYYTDADRVTLINTIVKETVDSLAQAQMPVEETVENIVERKVMLQTMVQFNIDKANIPEPQKRNVYSVAAFLEHHPEKHLTIVGYADIETAYPSYNLSLSRKRAEKVYDMLVKECGVDPARLKVEWKGDTEIPFQLVNEWNRAVVFYIE